MSLFKKMSKKNAPDADDSSKEPSQRDIALALSLRKQARPRHKDEMVSDDPIEVSKPKFAKGGVADAIRSKKSEQVDLQANADEDLNMEDDLSFDAARKPTYFDDSQIEEQPEDSNMHGDEIAEAAHDMISAIRKKMKSMK